MPCRLLALQLLFTASVLLIWADFMWGRDDEDNTTAAAADEYVRSRQVAY